MSGKDNNVFTGVDACGEESDKMLHAQASRLQAERRFEQTRALAQKARSKVSIHRGENRHIRGKFSQGNDPTGTKG